MGYCCWARISLVAFLLGLLRESKAQVGPGPILSSQTISILGDELYVHGGSRLDSFLEDDCSSELWRLRLGHSESWNLSSAVWEAVPLKEGVSILPPVSGMGLKSINIPGNDTLAISNGTSTRIQSISPFMVEFGRRGCAYDNEKEAEAHKDPWIGFNMYNPVMNTWDVMDLVNATRDLGLNRTETLVLGDWTSPTVAVDYVGFAWYIILQSTTPLRQVLLRKDLASLVQFMERVDLTESSATVFPSTLLLEGWNVTSVLNETAPFVGKGVATVVRNTIVILSGTANSFTAGDADLGQLRGCDHAYLFSLSDNTWTRQDLTVVNNGAMPDTREKAAFLAVGSKIYMHGGVKPYQTVLSDLWILDTETWTWQRGPDGPGPRADHTLLQYHDYIMAVSGFDVGRNVPVASTLPVMAFDTNTTSWTDTIRPTMDVETSFITNVTRIAIITGTVIFALVMLVIALSTHLLRKWNQRNYTKVDEDLQLEEQSRRRAATAGQGLPSILKNKYLSESSGSLLPQKSRGARSEVLFEDVEGDYEDDHEENEDDDDSDQDDGRDSFGESPGDEGDRKVQKVSLLSRAQANPTSRPPTTQQQRYPSQDRRVRMEDSGDNESEMDGDNTEDEPVVVSMPPDISR
ncbi:hypothetical protein KVV02_008668 [Mortierella alpina]|uniref:Uncharacterized protein n=1 Tax=Mortierella alpina TaxID=64518 RepID=A0A9P8A9I5_MORAP|nr:hypothetical protein KVV02_008668 [Mortierella alpina]